MPEVLTQQVRAAVGDGWQADGRLRERAGGGTADLPGVRLMASGLPHPQWNSGDVTDVTQVDLARVRDFYASHGDVPYGLRVPAEQVWPAGRRLFRQRCMGLRADGFRPAPTVPGLVVRMARAGDLDAVVAVDAEVFEFDPGASRSWTEPMLGVRGWLVLLACLDGQPVGVGTVRRSDGRAGAAAFITGVGVLAQARGRGVGSALSTSLVAAALGDGARLVVLCPDNDGAARIYSHLGFVEYDGLDVYVER